MKTIVILAVCLLASTASASDIDIFAASFSGRVVDAHGNGVSGAVVAAKWVGVYGDFGSSATTCLKAIAVKADEAGHFMVHGWQMKFPKVDNVFAVIEGYKSGYIRDGSASLRGKPQGAFGPSVIQLPSANVTVRVKPLTGQPDERRDALAMQLRSTTCTENDFADLRPLYLAAREDISALPPEMTAIPGERTLLEIVDETIRKGNSGSPRSQETNK